MYRTRGAQTGLTLVELAVSLAIAAILIAPLVLAMRNATSAQSASGSMNDINRQARFALQRMAAAVRRTPSSTVLGAKASNTTGDWLAPSMYCLNGAGALIETTPADASCSGASVIATGVTTFSAQTYSAGPGAAPVIEVQLGLAGSQGATATLTSRARLGGGIL